MIINSILDNDKYIFTMGQAILKTHPNVESRYTFINRGNHEFDEDFLELLDFNIYEMKRLKLTKNEYEFMAQDPCYEAWYLDYLKNYRFDPEQVFTSLKDGNLELKIEGLQHSNIYWEVPLLSTISELYFRGKYIDENKIANMHIKANNYNGIPLIDFGTRRRHSYNTHRKVIECYSKECNTFMGTSNVHFAQKYGLKSFGTQAHLWDQLHAAIYGYKMGKKLALENWINVYKGQLGIALTDTFTTENFFEIFDGALARTYDGVRQDSGKPMDFFVNMVWHYKSLGIDPHTKKYIFSDGLDLQKAKSIYDYTKGYKVAFGIGTSLTNDVGLEPLNMVIKLTGVRSGKDWVPAIKLSDSPGKHTGDKEEIELCKKVLRLK